MKKPPQGLLETQQWFAEVITQLLTSCGEIQSLSPKGQPIQEEALRYIAPSPFLQPHQRIQIYNQQYWYRMLSNLHEILPLLTCLCGYESFNQRIGIPYLQKYPSNDWSLATLAKRLPQWIEEEYPGDDKSLVLSAARVDVAYQESFLAKQLPDITNMITKKRGHEKLLNFTMRLQPHMHLLEMDYNLLPLREEVLKKEPDQRTPEHLPKLLQGKKCHYIIYRSHGNDILWKDSSKWELLFLRELDKGRTMTEICTEFEALEASSYAEIENGLPFWIQEWLLRRWLAKA